MFLEVCGIHPSSVDKNTDFNFYRRWREEFLRFECLYCCIPTGRLRWDEFCNSSIVAIPLVRVSRPLRRRLEVGMVHNRGKLEGFYHFPLWSHESSMSEARLFHFGHAALR